MTGPVVQRGSELLPLLDDQVSWESFERFCLGYVTLRPEVVRAHRYGKGGEGQKGIDIIAYLADGSTRSYQCRRYKRFTTKQTERTVTEDTYGADEHVILIACEASVRLRDLLEAQDEPWWLEDVEDLSNLVRRELPRQRARELVEDCFGAPFRRSFLGPQSALAFLSPPGYYAPYLQPGRLLHHRASLRGREQELAELREAALDDETTVVALSGVGGSGKSRLLRELAEGLEGEVDVLVAVDGVPLTAELVDDLPDGPLVVIVEDAHGRGDLAVLLARALRATEPFTVVLSTRPHGRASMTRAMSDARLETARHRWLGPLEPLADGTLEEMARELLGEEDERAGRVAELSGHSPLLLVLSAGLLADSALGPEALRASEGFRSEVLGRFADEQLGEVSSTVPAELVRQVAETVSALGPIAARAPDFVAVSAARLGVAGSQVIRAVAALESAGVLERAGVLRRVRPDVLADRLLEQAAVAEDGEPTGWVDELLADYGPSLLERLLFNCALLDWMARAPGGRLSVGLWDQLRVVYDGEDVHGRRRLMETIARTAQIEPGPALRFVEHALSHPVEPTPSIVGVVFDQNHVERGAIGPLEVIARHPEHVERAMRLLWAIHQHLPPPPGGRADEAFDAMLRAGSYARPVPAAETMLRLAEQLLDDAADARPEVLPVLLLGPLLQREAEDNRMTAPSTLGMSSLAVLPDATAELRGRARELAARRAQQGGAAERIAAVRLIEDAMNGPTGMFGRRVPDDELDGWRDDQSELCEALEQLMTVSADPLVRNRVRHAAEWHTEDERWPEVAERCAKIIAIPMDIDELLLAETVEHWRLEADPDERRAARAATIEQLSRSFGDGRELAERLEGLLTGAHAAGLRDHAGWMLFHLLGERREWAPEMIEWLLEEPARAMDSCLPTLLLTARAQDPGRCCDVARELVGGPASVRRSAAAQFACSPEVVLSPSAEEQQLFEALLAHDDVELREAAGWALDALCRERPDEPGTFDAVLAYDPGASPEAVDRLAMAALTLGIERLSEGQVEQLMRRLLDAPELKHWSGRLVDMVGRTGSSAPLDMLIERLRRQAAGPVSLDAQGYRALPRQASVAQAMDGAPSAEEYGRRVHALGDLALELESSRPRTVAEVFWTLVSQADVGLALLAGWVRCGDEAAQATAHRVLRRLPWRTLLELSAPICELVEEMEAVGGERASRLQGALLGAMQDGGWTRTPGQPAARWVTIRDSARDVEHTSSGAPAAGRLFARIAEVAERHIAEDEEEDAERAMLFDS